MAMWVFGYPKALGPNWLSIQGQTHQIAISEDGVDPPAIGRHRGRRKASLLRHLRRLRGTARDVADRMGPEQVTSIGAITEHFSMLSVAPGEEQSVSPNNGRVEPWDLDG